MLIARFHAALPTGTPDAIHLLPLGKFTAMDGRAFNLVDAQAVVDASMAPGRDLVIDENHSTDYAAKAGFSAPAVGHITALEVRADGIWGKVTWNDDGQAMLAKKSYDSVSAVIKFEPDGSVSRILRAALTNDPAVPGLTRLFHNQEPSMDLAAIRAALGLPDTADEAACLEAARVAHQARAAATAQLATFATAAGVPGATTAEQIVTAIRGGSSEVATLAAQVTTLTANLEAQRVATLQREAEAFVDGAIRDGKPILSRRDRWIALFMADPAETQKDIAALQSLNASGAPKPPAVDPAKPETALTETDRKVAELMGIDIAKFAAYKAANVATFAAGGAA